MIDQGTQTMAHETRDPVTGRSTTGHEWNGIEELDTPVPRVVLCFLVVTILFSIVYWVLMPAWPLGWTYTKGLLGVDQREFVMKQVRDASAARAAWTDRIASSDFATIAVDPALMHHVRETGRALFMDNCAVCHGTRGTGGPGFPNLAAKAWLWGGKPEEIAETIRVGINSTHPQTRMSQMPPFGRDGILTLEAVRDIGAYVRSIARQDLSEADQARVGAGKDAYVTANCASCHGADGSGSRESGAPNLTDKYWIYGGDAQSVDTSIFAGRQGHMPHWEGRLSPVDIKVLTLYVGTLSEEDR
jgi:cytochrome c oxidase cbb3-type subunit 3